jgi:hypothetical protein
MDLNSLRSWARAWHVAFALACAGGLATPSPARAQPTLVSTTPATQATGVAPGTPVIFTFSVAMDTNQTTAEFLDAFNPLGGDLPASAAWSADCKVLTCSPSPSWPAGDMIIWGVTGASKSGDALPDGTSGMFTTAQQAPTFTVVPADKATGVPRSVTVVFTFAVAMNTAATEALFFGSTPPTTPLPVNETWSSDQKTLTCTPTTPFPASKSILWSVAGSDASGNTLPETEGTFVTGTSIGPPADQVVSRGQAVQQTGTTLLQTVGQEFVALSGSPFTNGITVTAPAHGRTAVLTNAGWPAAFEFEDSLSTASFATNYPAGNYLLTVPSSTSSQTATLSLTDGPLPSAPHFLNWQSLTNAVIGQGWTLQWDFATGGTTVDYLRLEVRQNGAIIFATPMPDAAGALTGSSNLVTVPTAFLTNAGPAQIRLMAFSWLAGDSSSITGAIVRSARHCTTSFQVQLVQGSAIPSAEQVYGLFLGQSFQQVGSTVTPLSTADWECWVRGFTTGQLADAEASGPTGTPWSLTLDDQGATLTKGYPSATARAADFPTGQCALAVTYSGGSAQQVQFNEQAANYPPAPTLSADMWANPILPGTDLTLVWQPDPNATIGDCQMLIISNPMELLPVFSTPWPGQPGALSGTVTNITVPGNLLQAGNQLWMTLTRYRIASRQSTSDGKGLALAGSAAGIFASLSVANPSQNNTNDIAEYRLLTGKVFTQSGQSAPVAATNAGFVFEASVWSMENDDLTNVAVVPPGGAAMTLPVVQGYELWQTNLVFDHEADLWAAVPTGSYQWRFKGTANGLQTATNALVSGAWPAPLSIANWADLQTQSFSNDVNIVWTLPAGASPDDQIELLIVDSNGKVVFRSADYAGGGPPFPGTNTSFSVAADTLFDGQIYQGRLRYIQVTQQDTQTIFDATGLAGRFAETRFALGTQMHPTLRITQFGRLPGQRLQMGLNAQINEPVTVQVSPDLKQWHTLFSTNMPPLGVFSWTNSQAGATSFYRACRGTP